MTSGSYEEFDAHLTRVALHDADAVAEVVATVRRGDRTPSQAIAALDLWFLRGQTMDAGVRAAGSAVPLVGSFTGEPEPDAGEPRTSLRRTMVYLVALADLHGVDIDDTDTRKTLVTAVLLGDEGARLASGALASRTGRWARGLAAAPMARLAGGNPLLATLVHKLVDGGVTVAVASSGEAVRARAVVAQARRAFGDPPVLFEGQTPRPEAAREPTPNSVIYARALARTIHKARKRAREG